jgi:hypothetical protein
MSHRTSQQLAQEGEEEKENSQRGGKCALCGWGIYSFGPIRVNSVGQYSQRHFILQQRGVCCWWASYARHLQGAAPHPSQLTIYA